MDPDRFDETVTSAPAESEIDIIYEDGGKPNETITVEIDNGGDPPVLDEVPMTLDASGKGTVQWSIPAGWTVVNLNGPDSAEHTVTIQP
jgi:hypothetical protein